MCSSCCYSCLKGVVMMVNMVVMLLGLSMAGVAVWLLVSEYLYLSSSWSDFSLLSCVVLALGLLGSVVAFLACCGAITNSRCLLGMFIIFLLALLVGEVSLALLIYFKVSICNIVFLVVLKVSLCLSKQGLKPQQNMCLLVGMYVSISNIIYSDFCAVKEKLV